jgi:Ribbon-helix-helix protein, copG family
VKSERLITLVDPKLLAKVNAAAQRSKVSQAEIVRRALEAFLK